MRVEGFTDRMPDWMAASDVLVHSTCGLTVLKRSCAGALRSRTDGDAGTSAATTGAAPLRPGRGRGDARRARARARAGPCTPAAARPALRGPPRRPRSCSPRATARAARHRHEGGGRPRCRLQPELAATWCWPAPLPLAPRVARGSESPAASGGRSVALTFDDGPHPHGTPASSRNCRPPERRRPSSWWASRSRAGRRWPRRSRPQATRSASTDTSTGSFCGGGSLSSRLISTGPSRSLSPQRGRSRPATGRLTASSRRRTGARATTRPVTLALVEVGMRLARARDSGSDLPPRDAKPRARRCRAPARRGSLQRA